MFKKRPQKLSVLLGKLGENLGVKKEIEKTNYNREWKRVVGEKIAFLSRVLFVKKKNNKLVLVVGVSDSVWLNELNYLKKSILRKMSYNTLLAKFSDLQFVFDKKKKYAVVAEKIENRKSKNQVDTEYYKEMEKNLTSLEVPEWVKEKLKDYIIHILSKR